MPVTSASVLEIAQQAQDPTTGLTRIILTDTAGTNEASVDSGGGLKVAVGRSATSAVTSVASSASSVTILASNASRLGAMVFNDSAQILYLKMGATASTSSYTVQIAAGGYYELPGPSMYTGIIDGIWASADGNARITELSA